jgi:gliding motility-associated-like protein
MKIKLFFITFILLSSYLFAQANNGGTAMTEVAIIQSSITPNGDGVNDFFIIKNIEQFPSNELYIFDKSGNLVYHTEYYYNTWDAKKDGAAIAEDMYYYVFDDGRGTMQTGYLQVSK